MKPINAVLTELRKERDKLNAVIASLEDIGGTGKRGRGRPPGRKRRRMSAAGRARIAAAQRKRWAKVRAGKK